MARKTKEWHGKTDDTPVPPRVRLRNYNDHKGHCHICGQSITGGQLWETDHVVRLKDGGENREGNLAPAHKSCHAGKSGQENTAQAKTDKVRKKHLGIKKRTGRPLAGTKASGWRKRMSGKVERWDD